MQRTEKRPDLPQEGLGERQKTDRTLLIEPRDPLLVRDARPFSSDPGARAFTLPWPWPRTIARTIRSLIGTTQSDTKWMNDADRAALATMGVHGPLMVARQAPGAPWSIFVPAPLDVVFHRDAEEDDVNAPDDSGLRPKIMQSMILRPKPLKLGEGVLAPETPLSANDQPAEQAFARMIVDKKTGFPAVFDITADVKPAQDVPAWWRLEDAVRWLAFAGDESTPGARCELPLNHCDCEIGDAKQRVVGLSGPLTDARTHVSIRPETQTGVEGALFTTESLAFPSGYLKPDLVAKDDRRHATEMAMLVRLAGAPEVALPSAAAIGGERRLSRITDVRDLDAAEPLDWPAPMEPPATWTNAKGLRVQLVTPAIFRFGWLPGWVADGTIPGLGREKIHLELVGAVIDRRQAVSGWYSRERNTPRHPKSQPLKYSTDEATRGGPAATNYVVPAGSVYFFRLAETSAALTGDVWKKLWLAPISDLEVSRNQGFGLMLPGVWDPTPVETLQSTTQSPEEQR